jgi:hypothetical protein
LPVTNTPVLVGTNYQVTLEQDGFRRFFRLQK